MLTVEQQRERERQRLREEEERRKRFLVKKDHHYPQQQQPLPITSVPKFEQLVVDRHNEETSRPSKTKTPSSGPGNYSNLFLSHLNCSCK